MGCYIDEIRLWNVVRTQAEIAQYYQYMILPTSSLTNGLVAYWPIELNTNPAPEVISNNATNYLLPSGPSGPASGTLNVGLNIGMFKLTYLIRGRHFT